MSDNKHRLLWDTVILGSLMAVCFFSVAILNFVVANGIVVFYVMGVIIFLTGCWFLYEVFWALYDIRDINRREKDPNGKG